MINISFENKVLRIVGHAARELEHPVCVAISAATQMLKVGLRSTLGLSFPLVQREGLYEFNLSPCYSETVSLLITIYLDFLDTVRKKYPREIKIASDTDTLRFPNI